MRAQPHSDDGELVNLAIAGNQHAFSLLMNRHKESLCSYMQHRFPIGDAVEDLILITFDKAFRNLERYSPQFAFTTWLYTIADNTCIDYIRHKRALSRAFRQASKKFEPHYAENTSARSDPESELIASQEAALLMHSINRLKPIYRNPARLRFLHDYAYEEIARELSIPEGTVKTRIHRAKEILSQWMTQL